MTTRYDPTKHMLVAVFPETGEHVHVPLPDLVKEVQIVERQDPIALNRVAELEAQVQALTQSLQDAAASYAHLMEICRRLDDRITTMASQPVQIKQVAA